MGRLPPINRRPFDNTRSINSPPPRGEVGSRSDPGGDHPASTDSLKSRARRLRTNATEAERYLWFFLRSLKPHGHHFRRQAPLRHYILDFVCHSAKLVIEFDGAQHADPDAEEYDARRTAFLESQGYRVLRFWDGEVLKDREYVMLIIWRSLESPTRNAAHSDLPTRGR
jgi:very-short-patch-repair endonuclease